MPVAPRVSPPCVFHSPQLPCPAVLTSLLASWRWRSRPSSQLGRESRLSDTSRSPVASPTASGIGTAIQYGARTANGLNSTSRANYYGSTEIPILHSPPQQRFWATPIPRPPSSGGRTALQPWPLTARMPYRNPPRISFFMIASNQESSTEDEFATSAMRNHLRNTPSRTAIEKSRKSPMKRRSRSK
jgi:hypothetical protein